MIACPTITCDGFVMRLNEPDSGEPEEWVCGECGNMWPGRRLLDDAITAIVASHPYRRRCYRQTPQGWDPVEVPRPARREYEKLVSAEWDEVRKSAPTPVPKPARKRAKRPAKRPARSAKKLVNKSTKKPTKKSTKKPVKKRTAKRGR
jgi:hypothetical protein